MESLASMGRLVTVGAHAGTTASIDLKQLYLRRQTIIGSLGVISQMWNQLLRWLKMVLLAPIIHKFSLYEASEHTVWSRRKLQENSGPQ